MNTIFSHFTFKQFVQRDREYPEIRFKDTSDSEQTSQERRSSDPTHQGSQE